MVLPAFALYLMFWSVVICVHHQTKLIFIFFVTMGMGRVVCGFHDVITFF